MLTATVRHAGSYAFLGKGSSGHWVPMDGSAKIGAEDGAARPKELLLLGLGGCTGFDVVMVLKKRRVAFEDLQVELVAEEASDHPMVFTKVSLTYKIRGDVSAREIERAVRLSHETYCSVSAMLRMAFPIEWNVILNGEEALSSNGESLSAGVSGELAENRS